MLDTVPVIRAVRHNPAALWSAVFFETARRYLCEFLSIAGRRNLDMIPISLAPLGARSMIRKVLLMRACRPGTGIDHRRRAAAKAAALLRSAMADQHGLNFG